MIIYSRDTLNTLLDFWTTKNDRQVFRIKSNQLLLLNRTVFRRNNSPLEKIKNFFFDFLNVNLDLLERQDIYRLRLIEQHLISMGFAANSKLVQKFERIITILQQETPSPHMSSFGSQSLLSDETRLAILKYLSPRDLKALACTCRNWQNLAENTLVQDIERISAVYGGKILPQHSISGLADIYIQQNPLVGTRLSQRAKVLALYYSKKGITCPSEINKAYQGYSWRNLAFAEYTVFD